MCDPEDIVEYTEEVVEEEIVVDSPQKVLHVLEDGLVAMHSASQVRPQKTPRRGRPAKTPQVHHQRIEETIDIERIREEIRATELRALEIQITALQKQNAQLKFALQCAEHEGNAIKERNADLQKKLDEAKGVVRRTDLTEEERREEVSNGVALHLERNARKALEGEALKLRKTLAKLENKYEEAMTKLDEALKKVEVLNMSEAQRLEKKLRRDAKTEDEPEPESSKSSPPKKRLRIGQGLWK